MFKQIIFLKSLLLFVSFSWANDSLESHKLSLTEACIKRSVILKRTDDLKFCNCFARNHIILASANTGLSDTEKAEQLKWLALASSGELSETEVQEDPFILQGSAGWIAGIDKECKKRPDDFMLDESNPVINP